MQNNTSRPRNYFVVVAALMGLVAMLSLDGGASLAIYSCLMIPVIFRYIKRTDKKGYSNRWGLTPFFVYVIATIISSLIS